MRASRPPATPEDGVGAEEVEGVCESEGGTAVEAREERRNWRLTGGGEAERPAGVGSLSGGWRDMGVSSNRGEEEKEKDDERRWAVRRSSSCSIVEEEIGVRGLV